jgi:hypothetical protein
LGDGDIVHCAVLAVDPNEDLDGPVMIGDFIKHQPARLLRLFENMLLEPAMIHAGPDGHNVDAGRVARFKGMLRNAIDSIANALEDLPSFAEQDEEEEAGDERVAAAEAPQEDEGDEAGPALHQYGPAPDYTSLHATPFAVCCRSYHRLIYRSNCVCPLSSPP